MVQFYFYSAALSAYAAGEYYFKFRYKTKAKTKEFDWSLYLITIPFFIIMIIPILAFMRNACWPSPVSSLLFLIVFSTGVIIRFLGLKEIQKFFSQKIELDVNHVVIATGIYKHIRHPLYLGLFVMAVGVILYWINIYSILGFFILILGFFIRITKEENFLMKNLNGYKEYAKKTSRVLPKLF